MITRTTDTIFKNSLNINISKILGKAAKLLIFIIVVGQMLSLTIIAMGFNFVFQIYENSTQKYPRYEAYITAIQFLATTITTVGYGENAIIKPTP